ncbi:hypothetical protein KF840_12075 [bacterium]|nr:hypothetical protein [bacterium]
MRPAPSHRAWLCAAILLWLMAGCGGESSVSVGVPTENNGPVVNGQVRMPSGRLAAAPSALERLAGWVVTRVEALVANNVFPVGAGVEVRLLRIGPSNVRNGTIRGGETVNTTTTGSDGSFALRMPTGTNYGTCRYVVEVGNTRDRTLTRAFVDSATVDITFESEAALRLLLDEVSAGRAALCDLDADEIRSVRRAVQDSPNQAFGLTAAAINASAETAAGSDPNVRAAIANATGQVTPPPTSTSTAPPPPTATATDTAPVPTATAPGPPTRTNTSVPTRTNTTGPTRTNPPPATDTAAPTRTNTPAPTDTATSAPTETATTGPTATATSAPTGSATPVPTGTATTAPTTTAVHTNTPLPTSTATAPPTPTATTAVVAAVNLGVVAGTAGFAVDVPITLVANDAPIASVATDIEFDAEALSVVASDDGKPDCRIAPRLAGVKDALAHASGGLLRLGIIGLDNNALIGSGPLAVCRFLLSPAANGSYVLRNTPEAAGQQAQAIAVTGSDGRIDVSAAPGTLGLSAGTAAAGGTAEVTASLTPRGQAIAAVSTDIRFPADRLSAGAAPDCTVGAAAEALGKQLVAALLPEDGEGRAGVRVGVFGRDNNAVLPDGALFACRFTVESGGGAIVLEHTAEGASPAAAPIGLLAEPGAITVP